MLIGFNNDVEYKGQMYHIQTEDHGIKDGHITTILFYSGQILDSKKISYQDDIKDVDDEKEREKAIKKRMVDIHREFYKKLFDGEFEEHVQRLIAKKEQQSAIVETVPASPNESSAPAKPKASPPPLPDVARPSLPEMRTVPLGPIPAARQAFRGIKWPDTDLRIDGLVVEFLESA